VFITKKRKYKIGMSIIILIILFLLIGDYKISRSMGISTTIGAGTGYEG
jgi:hypothetical protein